MQFFIVALALVAAVSALPQQRQQAEEQPIAILRQAQDISPEGAYRFNYETENGIQANENGAAVALGPKGEVGNSAQGSFTYTAPDGTPISVRYSANENGFQPEGDHLPVAPAIPEQIQRALDYIAAHPQKPEDQH